MAAIESRTDSRDVSAPFWQGVLEHKFLLQFDKSTGRAQFYPRPQSLYSEHGTEWREASGRGTLLALTLSRVAPKALAHLSPYPLALVRLQEGPRVLARIDAPYASLRPGQALVLAWDDSAGDTPMFIFRPAA